MIVASLCNFSPIRTLNTPLKGLFGSLPNSKQSCKYNPKWLNTPFAQLHWYGKEVRAGRKVGHINLSHLNKAVIIQQLEKLRTELPEDYQSGLNWAIKKLK